jgi:NAD(P)H-hydrate epimerase
VLAPRDIESSAPDVVVDALIGYGLADAPRGSAAQLIKWANQLRAAIVSLDVPSGVDATTGLTPGAAIHPRMTVTLALPKTGLSDKVAGEMFLADLGIPAGAYRRAGIEPKRAFDSDFVVPIQRT